MKDLIKYLESEEFPTSTNAVSGLVIQQTCRNKLKKRVTNTFLKGLKDYLQDTNAELYQTKDGIILSVYNEKLDTLISIEIATKIKGLEFEPELEEQDYLESLQLAEEKKKLKEKNKKS